MAFNVESLGTSEELMSALRRSTDNMIKWLGQKNSSYGNSVADPKGYMCDLAALPRVDVRIDDKISRMVNGHSVKTDNDGRDLLGYLMIKAALEFLAIEKGQKIPETVAPYDMDDEMKAITEKDK